MTPESKRLIVTFSGHVFPPKLLEWKIPSRWPWQGDYANYRGFFKRSATYIRIELLTVAAPKKFACYFGVVLLQILVGYRYEDEWLPI